MSSRLLITFILALVLAGAASVLVMKRLKQTGAQAGGPANQVVVAARNVELGSRLSEPDLKLVEWRASPPAGTFTKVADVVGRAAVYPLFQEEPVLEGKLAGVGSGAGLPAVIPDGMRAVSIRVDDVVAVAGFVGPGTRVDVLLTGDPSKGGRGGESEPLTKTILENVQVLAAGQKLEPDAQGKAERVNVVTLLCSPEDAAKVTLASSEGRIQLVLRNPGDKTKAEKQPQVGRQALYGGAAVPKPATVRRAAAPKKVEPPPPPAPMAPPAPQITVIEIIRAQVVSKVELPARLAQE